MEFLIKICLGQGCFYFLLKHFKWPSQVSDFTYKICRLTTIFLITYIFSSFFFFYSVFFNHSPDIVLDSLKFQFLKEIRIFGSIWLGNNFVKTWGFTKPWFNPRYCELITFIAIYNSFELNERKTTVFFLSLLSRITLTKCASLFKS